MHIYPARFRKTPSGLLEAQAAETHCRETAYLAQGKCFLLFLKAAAKLVGLLHDAGKFWLQFEEYLRKGTENPESVKRGEVTHSFAGAYILHSLPNAPHYPLAVQLISHAILTHHGQQDVLFEDGTLLYEKRLDGETPDARLLADYYAVISKEELTALLEEAGNALNELFYTLQAWLEEGKEGTEKKKSSRYGNTYFYIGMLARMLSSLLIDADRTGSAAFAEFKALPESKKTEKQAWLRAENALNGKVAKLQDNHSPLTLLRGEIFAACQKAGGKAQGVYRLIIPTGGGKTFASLAFALRHAARHGCSRIFYVAPYNSILEQNAAQWKSALGDTEVLVHHSNVVQDTEEESAVYKTLAETWDAPVVMTSAVQFLNTLFSAKSASVRRFQALSGAVIILDEVQALPLKCVQLCNLAINMLSKFLGATVVLCSATQPGYEFVGKNALTAPEILMQPNERFILFRRTRLLDARRQFRGGATAGQAAEWLGEKAKINASCLLVVNTKSCALAVYNKLQELYAGCLPKEAPLLFHLSTSMCPKHREKTIKALRWHLKKGHRLICVSTQLIEAGVDISFDMVARSLAGLDSIIQAAGRCNRHAKEGIKEVYILFMKEENLGSLPDIRTAQAATESVLDGLLDYPEQIDNDLFSEKAVAKFYAKYYEANKSNLGFPLAGELVDIADLLGRNSPGEKAYESRNIPHEKLYVRAAFKKAGQAFQVIDTYGIGIIVDYGNAMDLVFQLEKTRDLAEKIQLLRKLQPFTVNISETQKRELENILCWKEDLQLLVLPSAYYSGKTGVSLFPGGMAKGCMDY